MRHCDGFDAAACRTGSRPEEHQDATSARLPKAWLTNKTPPAVACWKLKLKLKLTTGSVDRKALWDERTSAYPIYFRLSGSVRRQDGWLWSVVPIAGKLCVLLTLMLPSAGFSEAGMTDD